MTARKRPIKPARPKSGRTKPAGRTGGVRGSHVNSGPPGHANEPGHANFDPKTKGGRLVRGRPGAAARRPGTVAAASKVPADVRGVHVNSGPPGHANEPGHANFDPKRPIRDPGRVTAVRGVHVNSGPPGHANGGGHANFDPGGGDPPPVAATGRDPRTAGVHVNSGPPGHANEPGHANFDPKRVRTRDPLDAPLVVTLPDGVRVTLPAGPADLTIRGFRISR